MLKNFLLVAFRNMKRSRLYSIINILGLAIGLATSLFIGIYIREELSYEKHFPDWENIYRLHMHARMNGNEMHVTTTGSPAAEALRKEIPGVINSTRLIKGGKIVKVGENLFTESQIFYADSTFFDIFSFKVIAGEKSKLLNRPATVVLTESSAKRYYSNKNPIGETLKIDGVDYLVSGVVEDCKRASHFHFGILISMISNSDANYPYWLNHDVFNIYVTLDPKADLKEVNSSIQAMVLKKVEPEIMRVFGISIEELYKKGNWVNYYLFPISDIHLESHAALEIEPNSNKIYIYIFMVIAIFILVIACINYMNLSTARSSNRSKETAIRKVVGARKSGLISQFLTESIFQSLISLMLALIFIETILPIFNKLTSQDLSFGYTDNIFIVPGLIMVGVIIGLISGIYSAIHLSSVDIIVMLKAKFLTGKQHKWFRNILVVFQFTISIFIIITTLIIFSQLKYIQNKDIGYDKSNMLVLKNIDMLQGNLDVLEQRLSTIPGIISQTASNRIIGDALGGFPSKSEDDLNTARVCRLLASEYNLDKTLGLEILEGRFFSKDFPNDTLSIVINETAAKEYNYKNPVGKNMVTQFNGETTFWKIIGVVKDFNFYSLHEKIGALVIMHPSQGRLAHLTIKYNCQSIDKLINDVKSIWIELVPNVPFEYYFYEDKYLNTYNDEFRTGKLFATFSILAIIISCLGLYGLASFLAEKKTREIAIRKVVGASEKTVVLMLIKQFTIWTLMANIFAYPIAWYFAKTWLQNFTYHVDIKVWYFIIATLIVFTIAILTVASQALMAARTNPAEKLKYE